MRKIILASASPRRKMLLEKLGLHFLVKPSSFEEKLNPRLGPRAQAEALSRGKAESMRERFKDALIIAADTIVVLDDEIIGKPDSIDHAKLMLKKLQGREHRVITGFTILDTNSNKSLTESAETCVFLRNVTDKEIDVFVKKEYVLDKAGAYNIDGLAKIFIEKIEGDYDNVVGLPMFALVQVLKKFDISVL